MIYSWEWILQFSSTKCTKPFPSWHWRRNRRKRRNVNKVITSTGKPPVSFTPAFKFLQTENTSSIISLLDVQTLSKGDELWSMQDWWNIKTKCLSKIMLKYVQIIITFSIRKDYTLFWTKIKRNYIKYLQIMSVVFPSFSMCISWVKFQTTISQIPNNLLVISH